MGPLNNIWGRGMNYLGECVRQRRSCIGADNWETSSDQSGRARGRVPFPSSFLTQTGQRPQTLGNLCHPRRLSVPEADPVCTSSSLGQCLCGPPPSPRILSLNPRLRGLKYGPQMALRRRGPPHPSLLSRPPHPPGPMRNRWLQRVLGETLICPLHRSQLSQEGVASDLLRPWEVQILGWL